MTSRQFARTCLISFALLVVPLAGAVAQTPAPSATPDTPATKPSTGPSSGVTPGNEGSTGWTGGTGGAYTGTSNHAPTPGSKTGQPETVTGVNPTTSGTTSPSK